MESSPSQAVKAAAHVQQGTIARMLLWATQSRARQVLTLLTTLLPVRRVRLDKHVQAHQAVFLLLV